MAKKTEVVEETTALTPTQEMGLLGGDDFGTTERPAELGQTAIGTDDIRADEIRIPRLAIAQGLSPQLTEGDPKYIDGLRNMELFNNVFGTRYGRGPLKFVVVRRDVRCIEFNPRSEGGGVKRIDVPQGDDARKWGEKDPKTGKGTPPAATEFIEFIALLLLPGNPMPEPVVISVPMKNKWNREAGRNLTTFIKLKNADIYSGIYEVKSETAKNDLGTFGVFSFKNAGFIDLNNPRGKALFEFAKTFSDSLYTLDDKGNRVSKKVETDREDDPENTIEGESVPNEPLTDDNIPF